MTRWIYINNEKELNNFFDEKRNAYVFDSSVLIRCELSHLPCNIIVKGNFASKFPISLDGYLEANKMFSNHSIEAGSDYIVDELTIFTLKELLEEEAI